MKTSTLIAAITASALLCLSGCDKSDPKGNSAGLVAVVDMSRLQEETGFNKSRVDQLKKLQDQLEPQFTNMQQGVKNALTKEAEAMGKFPTPAQQAKFEQMRASYSQMIEDKYTQIQTQLQQRDMELQVQFRQKVHDAISTAASERGMSVVIEMGPWMVAASDESNVTSAALSKLKASGVSFDGMPGGVPGSPGIPGVPGTAPGTAPGFGPGAAPGGYGGFQTGPSYPGAPVQNTRPVLPGTGPTPPPAPAPVAPAPAPATQPQ